MNFLKARWIAFVVMGTLLYSFMAGIEAQAGAVIMLRGELYSINMYDIQIKTRDSIFRVDRTALSQPQQKQINAPGVSGKIIQIAVPITAIKKVRPLRNLASVQAPSRSATSGQSVRKSAATHP
jgi:hypothetical protein